jgi:hypothetical protein
MYVTLGREGERKNESVIVPIDSPQIVKKMYDLHISELNYSISEMEDITGLMSSDIQTELLNVSDSIRIKMRKLPLSL